MWILCIMSWCFLPRYLTSLEVFFFECPYRPHWLALLPESRNFASLTGGTAIVETSEMPSKEYLSRFFFFSMFLGRIFFICYAGYSYWFSLFLIRKFRQAEAEGMDVLAARRTETQRRIPTEFPPCFCRVPVSSFVASRQKTRQLYAEMAKNERQSPERAQDGDKFLQEFYQGRFIFETYVYVLMRFFSFAYKSWRSLEDANLFFVPIYTPHLEETHRRCFAGLPPHKMASEP